MFMSSFKAETSKFAFSYFKTLITADRWTQVLDKKKKDERKWHNYKDLKFGIGSLSEINLTG